jgi:cytochrome c-type biogenesis protein CcmH
MAAQDGRIGPDAREAFDHALAIDPHNGSVLWWLGRADILAGRRAEGIARWNAAAAALPPGDRLRAKFEAAIGQAENGSFAQADAIANAPPEQQAQMVRGMVQGLAKRLETQRGAPQEWALLVRAYGAMGQTAERDRALARARALFANDPAALKAIEAAAAPPSAPPAARN